MREEALVGGVVVLLAIKIPDTKVESSPSYVRTVCPLTHIQPVASCGFSYTLFPQEMSYQCGFTTNSIAKDHELHMIETSGIVKLSI